MPDIAEALAGFIQGLAGSYGPALQDAQKLELQKTQMRMEQERFQQQQAMLSAQFEWQKENARSEAARQKRNDDMTWADRQLNDYREDERFNLEAGLKERDIASRADTAAAEIADRAAGRSADIEAKKLDVGGRSLRTVLNNMARSKEAATAREAAKTTAATSHEYDLEKLRASGGVQLEMNLVTDAVKDLRNDAVFARTASAESREKSLALSASLLSTDPTFAALKPIEKAQAFKSFAKDLSVLFGSGENPAASAGDIGMMEHASTARSVLAEYKKAQDEGRPFDTRRVINAVQAAATDFRLASPQGGAESRPALDASDPNARARRLIDEGKASLDPETFYRRSGGGTVVMLDGKPVPSPANSVYTDDWDAPSGETYPAPILRAYGEAFDAMARKDPAKVEKLMNAGYDVGLVQGDAPTEDDLARVKDSWIKAAVRLFSGAQPGGRIVSFRQALKGVNESTSNLSKQEGALIEAFGPIPSDTSDWNFGFGLLDENKLPSSYKRKPADKKAAPFRKKRA